MADAGDDALVKSVESLLADKQAVADREKKLIEDLNTALGRMGYRVVPTNAAAARAATPGRKPGRPAGSGKAQSKAAAS